MSQCFLLLVCFFVCFFFFLRLFLPFGLHLCAMRKAPVVCMWRLVFSFAQYLLVAKLPGLIRFIRPMLGEPQPNRLNGHLPLLSNPREENKTVLIYCKTVPLCEIQIIRTAIEPYILPALLCRPHMLWDSADPQHCCVQIQKDSQSACSRIAFPPESTKNAIQVACFHPRRKSSKHKCNLKY